MTEKDVFTHKRDVFTQAVEILNDQGHEASVHEDYSGRAMYGSTVDGITADCSGVLIGWAIMAAVMDSMDRDDYRDPLEVARDFLPTRTDSMGMSTIYY